MDWMDDEYLDEKPIYQIIDLLDAVRYVSRVDYEAFLAQYLVAEDFATLLQIATEYEVSVDQIN